MGSGHKCFAASSFQTRCVAAAPAVDAARPPLLQEMISVVVIACDVSSGESPCRRIWAGALSTASSTATLSSDPIVSVRDEFSY